MLGILVPNLTWIYVNLQVLARKPWMHNLSHKFMRIVEGVADSATEVLLAHAFGEHMLLAHADSLRALHAPFEAKRTTQNCSVPCLPNFFSNKQIILNLFSSHFETQDPTK